MNAASKITAAVVCRNGAAYLPRVLPALRRELPPGAGLLLVDDASGDGSPEAAARALPGINILRLPRRRGAAAARNAAIEAAGRGLLLLADCDAQAAPGAFACLRGALHAANALFAAPRIALPCGTTQHGAGRCHITGLTSFGEYYGGRPLAPGPLSSCGSTALLLDLDRLPRDLRFDEGMGHACEDADFALRAAMRGLRGAYAPSAVFLHLNPAASAPAPYSPAKLLVQARSRRRLVLKNFGARTILLTLPLHAAIEAATAALALRSSSFAGYLAGLAASAAQLPSVLRLRSLEQRARRVPDPELLTAEGLSVRPALGLARAASAFDKACEGWWRAVRGAAA